MAHRGPDGDGFFEDRRAVARPSPARDHRSRRRPPADGQRGRLLLDRLQRRGLQPSRAAAAARSQGPPVPHRVGHRRRSFTPTRSSARRASSGSKACSRSPSTTAARQRAVRRARSARQEAVLLHGRSTACCTLRASCRRCARCRAGRARSISSALEGYLSLGYFLAPATIYRDVHKLPAGALAARDATDASRSSSTGTSTSSTPIIGRRRSSSRTSTRRCAPPCTIGSRAKCRSARF